MWVARHDADKVSRIDPTSGTESVDVPAPERIAIGEGSVWVVAKDGRQLVRIDPRTRKVTRRIAADVRQGDCGDCAPGNLAIADGAATSSGIALLLVAVPGKAQVARYDARTGEDGGWFEMGPASRAPSRLAAGCCGGSRTRYRAAHRRPSSSAST